MKIQILYKVRDEDETLLDLTPEEYFDPLDFDSYVVGENFEDDSIPKFDNAEEYLSIPIEKLEWTKIEVTQTKSAHSIRTQYFDNGNSWMSHRTNLDGYEQIILSSRLNDVDWNIVRMHKDSEVEWKLTTNTVVTDMPDGSQTEKRIF